MANAFGQYLLILKIDLNTDCLAPSGIVRSLHIILACLYNQTKKTNYQHKTITNNAMGSTSIP